MSIAPRSLRLVALVALVGCAGDKELDPPQPPGAVVLRSIAPTIVLPRTVVTVTGDNLSKTATHIINFSGTGAAGAVDQNVRLEVKDNKASFSISQQLFAAFGAGNFKGTVAVRSSNDWGSTQGPALSVTLRFADHLTPQLSTVASGIVYLNTLVTVQGADLLRGGTEGRTFAELSGCILPEGKSGDCQSNGRPVTAQVEIVPDEAGGRRLAQFPFAPSIAGIEPGSFSGTVTLANRHADGVVKRSKPQKANFDLLKSKMLGFDQVEVSLGQYLAVRGKGFVGKGGAVTSIRFDGDFLGSDGKSRPVTFDIIGGFVSGERIRYALEERAGLGLHVRLRSETGTLRGKWTPTIRYGSSTIVGAPVILGLRVAPVKQVVWVKFSDTWLDGLRRLGARAADARIRARVFEVLRRDYLGINIEFRDKEPTDFKLYSVVEIAGKDPNGRGLLGYDNTPGKDRDNDRLHDRIGGLNAVTQDDGFPGYGGVFIESMFGFSTKPPSGTLKLPIADDMFDDIFDHVRPDKGGREITSAEALGVPGVTSTENCHIAPDRTTRVGCVIRVIGNLVGSTTSHEIGHSLGLAEGPADIFHNDGDLPNRLMDDGGSRSFAERAELAGEGPAVFCLDAYKYLRDVLPSRASAPNIQRPSCF